MIKQITLYAACVLTLNMSAQNSVLWRVSGNGLKKNSYLFGTIHIKDKRVFDFYDSLIPAIQHTDMLVLEISPDSMNKMISDVIQAKKNESNADNGLSDEENEELNRKLEDGLGVAISKRLKPRDLRRLRRYVYTSGTNKADDKPTFLDAYLGDIARRMGKKVGGLETLSEHEALIDDFFGGKNESDDLKKEMAQFRKKNLENLIQVYLKADLKQIEEHYDDFSEDFVYDLLTKRNIKMVNRYDSLIRQQSLFAAVGAAHLPGNSGLIELLRKKGYTVEPVLSARTGLYKKMLNGIATQPWQEFTLPDQGLVCMMPGKPEPLDVKNVLQNMHMYFDFGTGNIYYAQANSMLNAETEKDQDKRLDAILNKYEQMPMFQIKSKQRGYTHGLRSMELLLRFKENYEFKLLVLLSKRELYMLMAGYHKNNEHPEDITRFFNSFRRVEKQLKGWELMVREDVACELMMPGKTKENTLKSKIGNAEVKIHIHQSTDNIGNSYLLKYYDLPEGYHLESDKITFNEFVDNITQMAKPQQQEQRDTMVDAMPAQKVYMEFSDGSAMRALNVIRGERIYTLMHITLNKDTSESYKQYFNTFHLKDYKPSPLTSYYLSDSLITVRLPTEPLLKSIDTLDNGKNLLYNYTVSDKKMGHTYYVQSNSLNKYSAYENDSTLFASLITIFTQEDSITGRKETRNGNVYTGEYTLSAKDAAACNRLKVVVKGRQVYYLFAYLPSNLLYHPGIDSVFNSFRFHKEVSPFNPFESKTELVLKGLLSTDTTLVKEASKGISFSDFKKENIPLIQQVLLKEFPDDTLYRNTRSMVMEKWAELKDTSLISFIEKKFSSFKAKSTGLASEAMSAVESFKTREAYLRLKHLLLLHADTSMEYHLPFYNMHDSLELTRLLYPEILSLEENGEYAGLLYLTVSILDSAKLRYEEIKSYQPTLRKKLDQQIGAVENNSRDYINMYLIDLVSRESETEYQAYMTKLLSLKKDWITASATYVALNRNYKTNQGAIHSLAEKPAMRKTLYTELLKTGKTELFPKKYLTRRALAESELTEIIENDYEYPLKELEYIQEAIRDSAGIPQKFLLFRVKYTEKEMDDMLGISGPYPVNNESILTTTSVYSGLEEEKFDKKTMMDLLELHCMKIDEEKQVEKPLNNE